MPIRINKETPPTLLINGFVFLLIFAFLISGINREARILFHLFFVSALSLGFLLLKFQNKKSETPPHFLPILIFAATLQLYWIFSKNYLEPFYWSLLFSEGISLWFITYNLGSSFTNKLSNVFMAPVVIYTTFYFISLFFGWNLTYAAGIFFQKGKGIHQHIGSLWAVAIAYYIGENRLLKNKIIQVIFILTGVYFLYYANSRTAIYVILAVLLYKNLGKNLSGYFKYLLIIGLGLIVVLSGQSRSLIFSRPYFLQSASGFYNHPLGVGMGNFKIISKEFEVNGGPLSLYSDYTHNIFLESIVGVGAFALPFIYGLSSILYEMFSVKGKNYNLGYKYLFLALTFIFMFDLTYAIPGMFLLWFLSLGIAQKEKLFTA